MKGDKSGHCSGVGGGGRPDAWISPAPTSPALGVWTSHMAWLSLVSWSVRCSGGRKDGQ